MKKTLIALMALAGVACGASTIDAQWVTAPATAGDFYAGAWTFTFTLDETYTIADSGYILGAWWSPKPSQDNVGSNAIYLTETEGVLTLKVGRGSLNNTDLDKTTTFTQFNDGSSDYVVRSEAIERGVTYTLTATLTKKDSDKVGMLTISDNIGGTWTAETGDTAWYKNNMSGAGGNGANQSMDYGVNSGVAVVIPEPATATLSLLALAGLCARRRRA